MYLAIITKVYREAIDSIYDSNYEDNLNKYKDRLLEVNRRKYTEGFLKGFPNDTIDYIKDEKSKYFFAGTIIEKHPDNFIEINIKHKISKGDEIEFITPNKGIIKENVKCILDKYNQEIDTISAGITWNPKIYTENDLPEFTLIRTKNESF